MPNVLIFLFDLIIFENILSRYIPFMHYSDEMITLIILFSSLLVVLKNRKEISAKLLLVEKEILIAFLLFLIVGVLSTIIFKIQPSFIAILKDIFAVSKFIICYIGMLILSDKLNKEYIYNEVYKKSKIYITIFFIFAVFNIFFDFGMGGTIRYGFRSFKFLYSHPTFLVSSTVILLCILTVKDNKTDKLFIYEGLILLILTFRSKAFMFIVCFLILKSFKTIAENFKLTYLIYLFILGFVIFKNKIIGYFQFGLIAARPALYITGFKILVDYFPLGSGFGSFASSLSGKYYSPQYSNYKISSVIGLTPKNYSYMSDTFWPYIYGQFGFIGFILFSLIILFIFKSIRYRYGYNFKKNNSATCLFLYILISSIAEAVFTNTTGTEIFIIIATFLGDSRQISSEQSDNNSIINTLLLNVRAVCKSWYKKYKL